MSVSSLASTDAILKSFHEHLNREITAAAEPVIQAALKECEAKMRKSLAGNVVSLLRHGYSVWSDQHELHITVRFDGGKTEKPE